MACSLCPLLSKSRASPENRWRYATFQVQTPGGAAPAAGGKSCMLGNFTAPGRIQQALKSRISAGLGEPAARVLEALHRAKITLSTRPPERPTALPLDDQGDAVGPGLSNSKAR